MLRRCSVCLGKSRDNFRGFFPAYIFGDNHTVVVVINVLHLFREFSERQGVSRMIICFEVHFHRITRLGGI